MSTQAVRMRDLHAAENQLSILGELMHIIADSAANHFGSEFQIDDAVRCHNTIFVFHVLARPQILFAASALNQKPARRDIPQTDSTLDVSVEPSACHISHV